MRRLGRPAAGWAGTNGFAGGRVDLLNGGTLSSALARPAHWRARRGRSEHTSATPRRCGRWPSRRTSASWSVRSGRERMCVSVIVSTLIGVVAPHLLDVAKRHRLLSELAKRLSERSDMTPCPMRVSWPFSRAFCEPEAASGKTEPDSWHRTHRKGTSLTHNAGEQAPHSRTSCASAWSSGLAFTCPLAAPEAFRASDRSRFFRPVLRSSPRRCK